MINNKEKTNNDSFLEEAEDDLKGVRRFLRLSDKDEEDEEDDREKEKATRSLRRKTNRRETLSAGFVDAGKEAAKKTKSETKNG